MLIAIGAHGVRAEYVPTPALQSLGASDAFVPASPMEVTQAFSNEAFSRVWAARGSTSDTAVVGNYNRAATSAAAQGALKQAELMVGGKGASAVAQAVRYLRLKSITRSRALAQSLGRYAELRLVASGGYIQVANPNAPTRDLYRMEDGKRVYAQVKVSRLGPNYYLREMSRDDSSKRFIVPDDHVGPLKGAIEERIAKAQAPNEAAYWKRQSQRVTPLGADYAKLMGEQNGAVAAAERSLLAARTAWLQGGVLTLGFIGYDLRQASIGALTWAEFRQRAAQHGASGVFSTAAGVWASKRFPGSPMKIGGVAAVATFAVEEAFLTMRYQSFAEALHRPSFWVATARSLTVAAAGVAGGVTGGKIGGGVGAFVGGPGGAAFGCPLGAVIVGAGSALGVAFGFDSLTEWLDRERKHAEIAQQMDENSKRLFASANLQHL